MITATKTRGGTGALVTIAARNITRNKRRTVMCVVAAGIAVFFTIVMQAMLGGMMKGIEDVVQVFDTGHVSIASAEFEADKEYMPVQYPVAGGKSGAELEAEVRAMPGVKAVFPRITTFATLQDSTVKHAQLWGIDAAAETALNHFNLTERSDGITEGRYPAENSNECAIGAEMAKKAGLRIGDTIPLKTVSAQFSDKMWEPVITGIFKFDYLKFDEDAIIVDYERLSRLLVMGGSVQQLFIFTEKSEQSKAVAAKLQTMLGRGDVVRDWRDNYFVAMMQQSQIIYYLVELVFLIVASFLIINTVVMIIHERIKEIGMMGSLGMTRREIVQVFFFEALFLSVLGALCGVALGAAVTLAGSFFPLDFAAITGGGMKEFPVSNVLYLQFSPAILGGGFLFGVGITAVCTLVPSLKSAFVEPVEALRR
ncbi:MAG: FtsX-like permease family protein [Spirochaetaceae bacterium]|jgi:putative ABC transport system permease protein|nr:FtsX-like permease family protein [Spirochaetaceae bacterium]